MSVWISSSGFSERRTNMNSTSANAHHSPEILPSYAHTGELNHPGVWIQSPTTRPSEVWVAPMTDDVVWVFQVKMADGQGAPPFGWQDWAMLSRWQVRNPERIRLFWSIFNSLISSCFCGWKWIWHRPECELHEHREWVCLADNVTSVPWIVHDT